MSAAHVRKIVDVVRYLIVWMHRSHRFEDVVQLPGRCDHFQSYLGRCLKPSDFACVWFGSASGPKRSDPCRAEGAIFIISDYSGSCSRHSANETFRIIFRNIDDNFLLNSMMLMKDIHVIQSESFSEGHAHAIFCEIQICV